MDTNEEKMTENSEIFYFFQLFSGFFQTGFRGWVVEFRSNQGRLLCRAKSRPNFLKLLIINGSVFLAFWVFAFWRLGFVDFGSKRVQFSEKSESSF